MSKKMAQDISSTKQKMRRDFFVGKCKRKLATSPLPMYSLRMTNDELLALPIGTFTNFGILISKSENTVSFRNKHGNGTTRLSLEDKQVGGKRTLDSLEVITAQQWDTIISDYREAMLSHLALTDSP